MQRNLVREQYRIIVILRVKSQHWTWSSLQEIKKGRLCQMPRQSQKVKASKDGWRSHVYHGVDTWTRKFKTLSGTLMVQITETDRGLGQALYAYDKTGFRERIILPRVSTLAEAKKQSLQAVKNYTPSDEAPVLGLD